jgi:YD repeat-containing protein
MTAKSTFLMRAACGWALLASVLLCVLPCAHAQSSTRTISLPNQDYSESTADLSVKVLGGYARILRSWSYGKWYLNDRWSDLVLMPDPVGGVLAIARAERIYSRTNDIYSLDSNNRIRPRTDAQGKTVGWQWFDQTGNTIDYDQEGRILGYANPAGVRVNMVRDEQGRLAGVKDHLGRQVLTITYNSQGLPAQVGDSGGHSVTYQWTGNAAALGASCNGAIGLALLTQVTDSTGGIWKYTYTASGYLQTRVDPAGGQIALTYLTQPKRTVYTGNGGVYSTRIEQPQAARVLSFKNETAGVTNYTISYNAIKQQYLVGIQWPNGASQSIVYDNQGRSQQNSLNGMTLTQLEHTSATQDKITDARGGLTFIDYDSADTRRPVRTIYPDGSFESTQYDGNGRKTQYTSALGIVSAWSYDAKGNRTSSAHQGSPWNYNADNQLTEYPKTTPFSSAPALDTSVSYTAQGHTARETNSQSEQDYGYNAAERLTSYSSTQAGADTPSVEATYMGFHAGTAEISVTPIPALPRARPGR